METKNTGPSGSATNTQTIARNSFWYGIELVFSLVVTFCTSVAVARIVGKDFVGQARLGYFQYVVWLTNVTIAVGSIGLPATTRKYMAEYLNCGQPGVARSTYLVTLKIQVFIALGISAVALAGVLLLGDPQYQVASVLLVTAMTPRIIATIPSNANNAAEVMRRNTGPSLAGGITTTSLTILGLLVGWDLVGVAAALLVGNALECGLKLQSVESWHGHVARGMVSPELKKRMFAYSGQSLALLLLNIVVWDRSDIVILKAVNSDWKHQVLYFSYAFNLSERILMIPNSFGISLAATMMAQFGRGQARLKEMTVDGARYALLVALPLLVGVACIGQPLVLLLYREPYRPMIATLTIVVLLAIPKALVAAPTMLLQAIERQGFLIAWGCLCGVVDIGLDFLLTPHYGANGAAIANGAAQATAALGIWIYAWRTTGLQLRLGDFGRIMLSGAIMAAGVLAFLHAVPGAMGMFGAIALGATLWMIALRITGALKPEDASRFLSVGGQFPAAMRPHWNRLIGWLAPAGAAA
jgi:O-antigen/teichoic acid export membrane protein